ncbi:MULTISPECIES: response regulator transcription factor [Oceanobacillus]|uniref:Response regulator n=1 Tax=Oceanobacillus aidingensis TaxID=645964 RepID=A0ABV9K0U7_9BACI|nr:response regulator [Oceanobacillus oncorhynchi]MDM8101769.1 response regulator [Oceanobacillus oncorhynchi]
MNVVIAEDDYRVALLHEKYLQAFSEITVVGRALNGKELKELIEKEKVDLIILDIYFPDILGTELLHYLRMHSPNLDIIMVSASTDRQHLQLAKRYGVYQYLIKPVTVDDFTNTVKQYVKDRIWFEETGEFKANDTDYFLTGGYQRSIEEKGTNMPLPTGIDSITLEKVKAALREHPEGVTIDKMCQLVGISRTTARRYLEHIVSDEEATTILNYGVIGRPERRYILQ